MAALHAASFVVPRPWSAAEFAALLADPAVFRVADPGGFALGRAVAGEAELLTLAVAPGMRRQGIGARLLAAFEARAAAAGAAEAWLETAADNAAARALYAAAGWQERGRRRGYFRRGDGTATDAVVMAKPLIHP
jgi:ribosomal-protein-alanine N-acetyltransferase